MENTDLFTAALQLEYPWKVNKVEFVPDEKNPLKMVLHLYLGFERGATFVFYNEDGTIWADQEGKPIETTAHDTVERTWQHLHFFQYETYIHAKIPRVRDGEGHCPTVIPPWARKNSGFTLLFEALVMELAKHMPVSTIAAELGVNDQRLWRVIRHYVSKARDKEDYSSVSNIGIDETSKKSHNYVTVVVDLAERKVIYVTEGKDHTTVDRFVADFTAHKGNPENIQIVTCDMSLGFEKGMRENFPNSKSIIDKFHIIKHANDAVDLVRREESDVHRELKGTKYLWLKNDDNLTSKQQVWKESLLTSKHLKTGRAYAMRVELQDIYDQCFSRVDAERRLKSLCFWMSHSRINQMKDFCGLIKRHWEEILNYFDYKFTNAILEGMNSIIQNVKRRARGFKNDEFFKTMIYLSCSKLDIDSVLGVV